MANQLGNENPVVNVETLYNDFMQNYNLQAMFGTAAQNFKFNANSSNEAVAAAVFSSFEQEFDNEVDAYLVQKNLAVFQTPRTTPINTPKARSQSQAMGEDLTQVPDWLKNADFAPAINSMRKQRENNPNSDLTTQFNQFRETAENNFKNQLQNRLKQRFAMKMGRKIEPNKPW